MIRTAFFCLKAKSAKKSGMHIKNDSCGIEC
jgi:hypothetical protein